MRRREVASAFGLWAGAAVLLAIGFVGVVSFPLAAALLLVVTAVYRVEWWMPWALGLALVLVLPLVSAFGAVELDNVVATFVSLLMALAVVLLVRKERKKLRSAAGQ